jgi:arabinose-5-phosphate isomerase
MSIGLKRDRLLRDNHGQTIASATRTLQLEAEGLSALKAALAGDLIDSFAEAIEILRGCRGRVIVTGMGKSGHVGLKVAATLSSTGSPAYFVHPSPGRARPSNSAISSPIPAVSPCRCWQ